MVDLKDFCPFKRKRLTESRITVKGPARVKTVAPIPPAGGKAPERLTREAKSERISLRYSLSLRYVFWETEVQEKE